MWRSTHLPPLSALRAFEAVARHRSFKLAADELAVTPSAVSHQIRHLEAQIGARLLDRSPRSVSLTGDGEILWDAVTAGFEKIRRALAEIQIDRRSKILTLTTTAAFLSQWLAPRLSDLQTTLPHLQLRFHASDKPEQLRAGSIDVAIRYGRGPYAGATTCVLVEDEFIVVCSPDLNLRTSADLVSCALIHIDGRHRPDPAPDWQLWRDAWGPEDLATTRGMRLPDSGSAIQAAIAGQGAAIISRTLVQSALHAGLLVQPFAQSLPGDAYNLVIADALDGDQDVASLRSWFVRAMRQ